MFDKFVFKAQFFEKPDDALRLGETEMVNYDHCDFVTLDAVNEAMAHGGYIVDRRCRFGYFKQHSYGEATLDSENLSRMSGGQ